MFKMQKRPYMCTIVIIDSNELILYEKLYDFLAKYQVENVFISSAL